MQQECNLAATVQPRPPPPGGEQLLPAGGVGRLETNRVELDGLVLLDELGRYQQPTLGDAA